MKSLTWIVVVMCGASMACVASAPAPAAGPTGPVVVGGGEVSEGEDGYDGDGLVAASGELHGDATCPGGSACEWSCPQGGCGVVCDGGSSCQIDCPAGGCSVTCAGGSSCQVDCPAGGCELGCDSGAVCEFSCDAGGCEVACDPGSTCSGD